MPKKPKFSVIIDIDKNSDTLEAVHFGEDGDGDTEFVCSRKLNQNAKEPLIAATVDIIECIAKKMKGKDYVLGYLTHGKSTR